MIKVVFCLRRLPSLGSEDFHRYWLEQHAPLVRACAAAIGIVRYTQSHLIRDPELGKAAEVRGCVDEPFDGVAEIWWRSMDELKAVIASDEGRSAARRLLEDERKFLDLGRCVYFYCEEHVVFPPIDRRSDGPRTAD